MTPTNGQIITFTKVPPGSYCQVGVAYRVDRPNDRGDYRFERVESGSATIDRPWAVAMAKWDEVAR